MRTPLSSTDGSWYARKGMATSAARVKPGDVLGGKYVRRAEPITTGGVRLAPTLSPAIQGALLTGTF
jgi:hypothetical protein